MSMLAPSGARLRVWLLGFGLAGLLLVWAQLNQPRPQSADPVALLTAGRPSIALRRQLQLGLQALQPPDGLARCRQAAPAQQFLHQDRRQRLQPRWHGGHESSQPPGPREGQLVGAHGPFHGHLA